MLREQAGGRQGMRRIDSVATGLVLATAVLSLFAPGDARAVVRHPRRTAPPDDTKLLNVMSPAMLSVEVPAFETFTGPALKVWPDGRRDYQVDGCAVSALTTGTTVTGLKLALGKTCTVDLNRFFVFPFDFPTADTMTLGDFDSRITGNNKITADCLDACPDGTTPTLHEHFVGSDLLAHLEVELDVAIDDDARRAALTRWTSAMRDGGGPDYVATARYQCDARFDRAAVAAFDKIKPTAVTIGYRLPAPKC
jgi:hypothetical protein